jgi:hypothetical protein
LQTNINTLGATVTANAATAAAATALKENSANKSSDVTLADATNTKFPTELAVKTFVTGQISTSNTTTNSAIAAVQADVDANETALNLKENLSNKSSDIVTDATSTTKYLTVKAIKDYVDTQNAAQNATRPTSDQVFATAGQTSFTLTQTPLTNTTTSPVKPNVWMFINGVRTNNLAYSVSGTTVTYSATNNNSYTLVVGDRVQFDYTY